MLLNELVKDVDVIETIGSLDVEITGIAYHTKDVSEGSCFVAISGSRTDGHDYVEMAVQNGAQVIVSSKRVDLPAGVVNLVVVDPRIALARISSAFFDNPSDKLQLIGITGTNGKTTITYILEAIWKAAEMNSGVVGTVNYRYGDVSENPEHTTPESYELQKIFFDMASAGVEAVAMEVSSHSLDQSRVESCYFDGGVFTNLTQDHLDYHLDMERYKNAKFKLFNGFLPKSKKRFIWAVINIDDVYGRELAKKLDYLVYTYSMSKEASLMALDVYCSFKGIKMKVSEDGKMFEVKSNLIGKHNASNILASIAVARAMCISFDKIKKGIESLECVPGRLEAVPNESGIHVLVDYAHTPDAIKNVTSFIKELKPKKLITVFGCGGDRDKSKRPLMGYEASLSSDLLIITSDNPRSENPVKIMDEIIAGAREFGLGEGEDSGYIVELNRAEAIRKAISLAEKGDAVLIAGKGHEDYQIIGDEKVSFDDVEIAKEILASL